MTLTLASKSPRRKDLLENLGLKIKTLPAEGEEILRKDLPPHELVTGLARAKAQEVFDRAGGLVIGADTIVVCDTLILGKPRDKVDAFEMLSMLSGTWHEVYTGLCVMDENETVCDYERTRVKFRELGADEIERYVETGEPLDKAGGYGIQGLGAVLVEGIEGDYFNVVGLPLCKLGKILETQFDFPIF